MELPEERQPEPTMAEEQSAVTSGRERPALRPAKPRLWSVLVVSVLVVPAMFVAASTAIAVLLLLGGDLQILSDPSGTEAFVEGLLKEPLNLVLMLLAAQATILAAAVIPAALSPRPTLARLGLQRGTVQPLSWLLFALATPVFLLLVVLLVLAFGVESDGTVEALQEAFAAASPLELVLLIGTMSLAPAVCEELFFRGYLLQRLLQRWHPFWAIFLTTLLFGLAHLDVVQSLAVLAFGAWVGLVYWRTGALWPCMLCHFANNLVATLPFVIEVEDAAGMVDVIVPIAVFGVAGLAFIGAIVVLVLGKRPAWRRRETAPPEYGDPLPAETGEP